MSRFKINTKGYWESDTSCGHHFDEGINNSILFLIEKFGITNVIDFGCGMGDYIKRIMDLGCECQAYDGNPNTPLLTNGIGKVLDFTEKFDLNKKFDLVISLEVGEHIPKEYENIFINNICNHSHNYIIISWAIIGQGGDGHVNCQNNDYIINEITKRGFKYDLKNTKLLRDNATTAWWFKNTIMVFKKIT
jgi:hypothetical protein